MKSSVPTVLTLLPVRAVLFVAATGLLSGCSTWGSVSLPSLPNMPEPWVKPYEREALADPIMQFAGDPLSGKHLEHVHDVREGARGATGVEGGGCGCN